MFESISQLSVKHIKVIMIRRRVLGGVKMMMIDDDDGYFCVLRGSRGGAQATAATLTRKCSAGDHTLI